MNETSPNPIKVLVVDDDPQCLRWTSELLNRREEIAVTGKKESGTAALHFMTTHSPDVIVVDMEMPEMNGVELTEKIRENHPETAIVLLSGHTDHDLVLAGLVAGARGYLSKDAPNDALVDAIRAAHHGATLLDSNVADTVIQRASQDQAVQSSHPAPTADLTSRERVIIAQLARGLSNKAIARAVNLSQKTVRNHLSHIFQKIKVASRQEALLYALHYGLDNS